MTDAMAEKSVLTQDRSPGKLIGLEAIRFLAALSVLVWHYQHFYYVADKLGPDYVVKNQPLYFLLAPFYRMGFYGVEVFWCISGYIFFWKYRNAIAQRTIGVAKFFMLRFSRLYPLHVMTLALVAILQIIYSSTHGYSFVYANNDPMHFLYQLVFASNWFPQQGYSFNGPIWSISVEVLVYVIFFATLRYIGSSLWFSVGAIAVGWVAKLAHFDNAVIDCLGFFYVGGMVCVVRQHLTQSRYAKRVDTVVYLFLVLIPLVSVVNGSYKDFGADAILVALCTPLIIYVCATDIALSRRVRTFIEAGGNMTYSSYLIHFPLQLAIATTFTYLGRPIPVHSAFFLCAFLITTFLLAHFIFEWFEKPMQKFIRALGG